MKIKFNTDDNIPLNKIIYFPTTTTIIRSVTQKDDYSIHFWYMSKNDAIALMTNSNLNLKNGIL